MRNSTLGKSAAFLIAFTLAAVSTFLIFSTEKDDTGNGLPSIKDRVNVAPADNAAAKKARPKPM